MLCFYSWKDLLYECQGLLLGLVHLPVGDDVLHAILLGNWVYKGFEVRQGYLFRIDDVGRYGVHAICRLVDAHNTITDKIGCVSVLLSLPYLLTAENAVVEPPFEGPLCSIGKPEQERFGFRNDAMQRIDYVVFLVLLSLLKPSEKLIPKPRMFRGPADEFCIIGNHKQKNVLENINIFLRGWH